ncbi:MAG: hypothetical protein PHC64_10365 [Candidatus Gastranaerophilales bacterium]|nr:hypothetical protein [Candidatus Gastranaerophilales bacterium]
MSSIKISLADNNIQKKDGNHFGKNYNNHPSSYAFIKQQMHEKHVDQFFWTDFEAPEKRHSWLAVLGSIAGAFIPVLAFGKKQNPELKLNSLKNIYKAVDIDYKLKEILAVGCGGAIGGLLGGLADRKEQKKLDKIEEATFQLMNISFPAILVHYGLELCKKTQKLNNSFAKITSSLLGIGLGAFAALKLANITDDIFFDKYNKDPERKFKKKDFIVHFDDIVGALVLTKMPLANKLHAEKLLPLIYTWSGYHVGDS